MSIHVNIPRLSRRKTNIIATLGPASNTREIIHRLIRDGANTFRLNMSQGNHDNHRTPHQLVLNVDVTLRIASLDDSKFELKGASKKEQELPVKSSTAAI